MTAKNRKEARALGLKQYYTGEPCKYGHLSPRAAANGLCLACNRERIRAATAKDPEGTAKRRRGRYLSNIESVKETQKAYREAHKEIEKARVTKWVKENPERELAKQKRWRDRNAHRIPELRKQWRNRNPGKVGLYNSNRRGLKNTATPEVPDKWLGVFRSEIEAIYAEARQMAEITGLGYDVDHVFPLSKGGVHAPWNLRILPASVNRSKHTKIPDNEPTEVYWHGMLVSRLIGH